jgi:LAO/AO transport system kinase
VETVGTGQSEVEITKVSDTSVLVLSPDSGDQVQVIKAGILEAADVFVVNKADKGGAEYVISRVEFMLGMRAYRAEDWKPCIVLTEAISKKGADELAGALLSHKEYLGVSGELEKRRKIRAREELLKNVETFVRDYCYQGFVQEGHLEELVDRIAQRKMDPHSAAMKIIDWLGVHFKQMTTH